MINLDRFGKPQPKMLDAKRDWASPETRQALYLFVNSVDANETPLHSALSAAADLVRSFLHGNTSPIKRKRGRPKPGFTGAAKNTWESILAEVIVNNHTEKGLKREAAIQAAAKSLQWSSSKLRGRLEKTSK